MQSVFFVFVVTWSCVALASGAYVEPMMGGGQVTQGESGMKHADISFENGRLHVEVDESIDTPVLRPLDPDQEFDPHGPWATLNGHAYNFQYGWNPARFDAYPPAGTWIWIEQLDASPELQVYQRPPAAPEGAPIFGTGSSSTHWRWSGSMTHNLYAVATPLESEYHAVYRVYIGSDATGEAVAGFEATEVTFTFAASPLLPGDYDQSGAVDIDDYQVWRSSFGSIGELRSGADGNGDGIVGLADYAIWRDHVASGTSLAATASVPETTTGALLSLLVAVALCLIQTTKMRAHKDAQPTETLIRS